jgi:transposase-like protein
MGFKACPHCDDGEAEALYAVDGKIEWYCHECGVSWTETPSEYEAVTKHQLWWEQQMQ